MFSFLMKYDSLTFPEAAKVLADRAGIDVPDIEISDEKRHEADLKNNIYEINAKAARYFHYLLGTRMEMRPKHILQRENLRIRR